MSSKTIFMVLGVFILVWAVLGFLDIDNFTSSGYSTGPDNIVTSVAAGGAAEAAGLQVGDEVLSIDGIDIDDSSALSSRPRAAVGDTRTLGVDRDGESMDIAVVLAAQSSSARVGNQVGILSGLTWAVMGLWAFFAVGSRPSFLLAAGGTLFAIPFSGGPYLGNGILSQVVGAVIFFCIVLAFAKLLHFMLIFPKGDEPDKRLLYGPAILMGLLVVALNFIQPGGPGTVFQFVFLAWIIAYVGLTLFRMIRTWSAASAEDRTAHGLNLLVAGTGLGLGLLLLNVIISAVAPNVTVPGQQWIGLSMVLVPISCALAAVRSARASAGSA